MSLKSQAQGLFLVFLGAASYGILATIVKYSNLLGIHTSVLTLAQFGFGAVFLFLYANLNARAAKGPPTQVSAKSIRRLMMFGTSTGLTSCFYYSSLQFIPVSLAIVLLMQSIWMGLIFETVIHRKAVEAYKIIGGLLVLFGTAMAANVFAETHSINHKGVGLGLLAALTYTSTLFASSHIETHLPSAIRSKYLVLGGLCVILVFWNIEIIRHIHEWGFLKWGLLLALFGTVLPPLLFTKGIPLIGIGMGAILASVELPVSILSAKFVLHEQMNLTQWLGVVLIIVSVIVVNKRNLTLSE